MFHVLGKLRNSVSDELQIDAFRMCSYPYIRCLQPQGVKAVIYNVMSY